MIEVLGLCIATAFAGYLVYPRTPQRISGGGLTRYRRLSDETRRIEIHSFE